MIFHVDQALFASNADCVQLIALLRHAGEGRHLILLQPTFSQNGSAPVNVWLDSLVTNAEIPRLPITNARVLLRQGLINALNRSMTALSSTTCTVKAFVEHRSHSFWDAAPSRLTLDDALVLAEAPLRIVVENRRNDGAFVRHIVSEPLRAAFERALNRGWLRFEHGGGNDILGYAEALAEHPNEVLRSWALLDSDASAKDKPSAEAAARRKALEDVKVEVHLLERRAIENYLPPRVVFEWAKLPGGRGKVHERKKRRTAAEKFEKLTATQKHYGKLKLLLGTDDGPLYRDPQLAFPSGWVRQEGFQQEANSITAALFERPRHTSTPTLPLVFDAEHGTIHRGAPELKPLWFPLRKVFDAQAHHDFAKRLKKADTRGLAANRFAHFVDAFFDAPVPVLTVLGDEPLSALKAFLNRTKKPAPIEAGPWWCDVCNQPIERAQDGWIEWLMPSPRREPNNRRRMGKGLRLVHHAPVSPRPKGCQYTTKEQQRTRTLVNDLPLEDFLGPDGLTQLLSLLLDHSASREEVARLISRLHTPGYERARFHFEEAINAGIIEQHLSDSLHSQADIKRTLKWADEEERET